MFASVLLRCIVRVVRQIVAVDCLAKPSPHYGSRGDVDVAIQRLEDISWDTGRMTVADLARNFIAEKIAGRLKVQHEKLCLEQGGLNPLASSRTLPLEQRN